jgi:hypothetical protein
MLFQTAKHIRAKAFFLLSFLLFLPFIACSQEWTLKNSGAGLIVDYGETRTPKIIGANTIWDLKSLKENGAIEGKYNGNQLFAAWIQGPETKEFLNRKGVPAWLCRYVITYPDGKKKVSELEEFYNTGFYYFGIKPEKYTEGIWKIEWYLVSREKANESLTATTIFQTIWGKTVTKEHLKFKTQ